MQAIVKGLTQWGAAHLATAPSAFEIAASVALTLLAFALFVLLVLREETFTPIALVAGFAFMVGLLILQTAALRLAHHRILQKLQ